MMIDLAGKQVVLNTVTLDGLNGIVNREQDGSIDLTYFFTPSDTDVSTTARPSVRKKFIHMNKEHFYCFISNINVKKTLILSIIAKKDVK